MKIDNINKSIGKKKIIEDVNLNIEKGKIYGFVGENGSGKSMLFKILAGWIDNDNNIKIEISHREFIEDSNLNLEKTGYENLLNLYNIKNEGCGDILYYLEQFGMLNVKDDKVSTYSLGMKQKIAIIQVIMEDADLYILDEPFNSLDKKSCEMLMYLLNEKRKSGKILIITSHINKYLDKLVDYIYTIKNGKIIDLKKNILKQTNYTFAEKPVQKERNTSKNKGKYLVYVLVSILCCICTSYIYAAVKLQEAESLYASAKYKEAYKKVANITYIRNNVASKIKYAGYLYNSLDSSLENIDIENKNKIYLVQMYISNKQLIETYKEKNKAEIKKYRVSVNNRYIESIECNLEKIKNILLENKKETLESIEKIQMHIIETAARQEEECKIDKVDYEEYRKIKELNLNTLYELKREF
ncbi:MAG: ABC transporter ATP-binding protein [Clostridia bacterium]